MPGNSLLGHASTSTSSRKLGVIIGVVGGVIAALTISSLVVTYLVCFHHRGNGNGHLPCMSDFPMPQFSKSKALGTGGKKKKTNFCIGKLKNVLSNCCGNYFTFHGKVVICDWLENKI